MFFIYYDGLLSLEQPGSGNNVVVDNVVEQTGSGNNVVIDNVVEQLEEQSGSDENHHSLFCIILGFMLVFIMILIVFLSLIELNSELCHQVKFLGINIGDKFSSL